MSIASTFQDAAAKIAMMLGQSVSVRVNGITGTALQGGTRNATVVDPNGQMGSTTVSSLFLSCAIWAEKPRDSLPVTVNGKNGIISNIRLDPAGAFWTVDYQETQPVEGV